MLIIEMECYLCLTQGQVARVSRNDFERFNIFAWQAMWDPLRRSFLAGRRTQVYEGVGKTTLYLSREIMGLVVGDSLQVDHINHDTLDNRRENLRIVTKQQNIFNRRRKADNTSRYKGVSYLKARNEWRARITVSRRTIDLGGFGTAEEAHAAYCEAACKYHGEFACFD